MKKNRLKQLHHGRMDPKERQGFEADERNNSIKYHTQERIYPRTGGSPKYRQQISRLSFLHLHLNSRLIFKSLTDLGAK